MIGENHNKIFGKKPDCVPVWSIKQASLLKKEEQKDAIKDNTRSEGCDPGKLLCGAGA